MEFFRGKSGDRDSHRVVQEQIGAESSPNDTYVAPTLTGPEENLTAKVCDLKPAIDQEGREIVTVETAMSGESERAESEFNTTETALKAQWEKARLSKRRRKIRVYFP